MFHKLAFTTLPLALTLVAGCTDQPGGDDETFVFGLTADQVLATKHVAQVAMTDGAWLDAHRGAFDCARYGDLCQAVGRERAAEIIELGYAVALDGGDVAAVRAAQDQAHADALRAAEAEAPAGEAFFSTNTNYFSNGSGNKRLKVVARAEMMWPSLELRASGSCTYQKDVFGWWASDADSVSGTLSGRFTTSSSSTTRTDSGSSGGSGVDLGPRQLAADGLTTTVTCSASDGIWSASGSASTTY